MTGHQINSLVGDLVAMAQAMERLPQCEHELKQAHSDINGYLATIQRLELKLIERANEIDALNAKARSLEVERDEAQFHTLEADDRTSRALDFIKATFGNAGSLIQALEPPAVKPVTEPEQPKAIDHPLYGDPDVLDQPQGESASPLPVSVSSPMSDEASRGTQSTPSSNEPSPAPEVAAQPDPTVLDKPAEIGPDASLSGAETTANVSQPTTTPSTQASAADQSFSMPAQSKPFEGRRYSEVVKSGTYPTLEEWEAGGGTVDNWYA